MEIKEQKGKVKINSHLETHGNYSVEWSYHFPLNPGVRIESELEVYFPREKLPGAARNSLAEANLSNTRLSLADAASEVRSHSLKFLRDSSWLRHNISIEKKANPQLGQKVSEHATAAFFLRAQEYWSSSFFSRTGLFLQSDLKHCANAIRNFVRENNPQSPFDWVLFNEEKRHLLTCLRSAYRLVESRREWENVFEMTGLLAKSSPGFGGMFDVDAKKFRAELFELSEFAIVLTCKALADVQGFLAEVHASLEGKKELEKDRARIESEQLWITTWVVISNELRAHCKLPSLSEVALDPTTATLYFERMRELQRKHYQAWDLDLNLKANEIRFDFLIGASAAAISAIFATLGLVILTMYQGVGTFTFREEGVFALGIFAVGNAVVYMLKDRLKEWLKKRFKKLFQSGRWVGTCVLKVEGDRGQDEEIIVADVEREVWWSRHEEDWVFHIWEEFRITPKARAAGARIIKQVWRIPLDEVLHSLDDSEHILRVPTATGFPKEVPVLKRTLFPYKLSVVVKGWKNKRMMVFDHEHLEGRIITAGRRLFSIE